MQFKTLRKRLGTALIAGTMVFGIPLACPITSFAQDTSENITIDDSVKRETGYITYKDTVVSTTRKNKVWVGYHPTTPNWAKASSYTLSKSSKFNISGSYTYEGITVNIGFSYTPSTSITIPANSSKYSRLGVRADYTFKKIKRQYYEDHVAFGKPSYRVVATRHAYYIEPVYR